MTFGGQLAAIALLVLQFGATVPRGDSMSALIVGQVVDGESGRPLAGAVVALTGPPGPRGPQPRVLTGTDGRFVFRGLRRGTYNINAIKPGYVDGMHGQTRPAGPSVPLPLADGERTSEPVVRLWRHASISGTVVDESGERLAGIRVQAYRRGVVTGERRYLPAGASETDDRGIYRISGLVPGDFIVGAVAQHSAMPQAFASEGVTGAATPPAALAGRPAGYPRTFHPNAQSGDAASIIALGPGAEFLSADLQLSPVPAISISGYAVGPGGPLMQTALHLIPSNTAEVSVEGDTLAARTDQAGRFTFSTVPQGHYTLRLRRGGTQVPRADSSMNTLVWADLPVSAGNEDIENLVVEAQEGLRIGGRVQFEGSGATSPPRPGAVALSIEPADFPFGPPGARTMVRVDAYGEFRSAPLPGGRYYIRVPDSPSGWMFKGATLDGRDVADTPVHVGADTMNVVVTFTDRWSGLRGSVRSSRGPDPTAAVIIFPTDRETWASSGSSPRRVREVRPGKIGEYALNLPPGDYFVIAVPDAQTADWRDPAFLDAASRAAVRVTLANGERKTQDLRTRELR